MTGKFFSNQYLRTSAIRAIVVAVVLILLFCMAFYPDTANAVCPEGFVESVENNDLDWYMDALEIEWVNDRVQSILQDSINYDFSELESNPVVIAIIDTGINYDHEIFQGKYDENGKPIQTNDIGEYDVFLRDVDGEIISKNMINLTNDAKDDSVDYHGTHVAGIVATFIHKLNLEKYIKIMPIKASYRSGKDSKFSVSVLKEAVEFALERGADIINLSLADTGVSASSSKKSDYDFITQEMASRAIFVSASGNNGRSSSSTVYYPAGSEYVIGVMNYTTDNEKLALSTKSNFGSKYDLCLPGASIYSADGSSVDKYKELSGTSMATPIASFACALKTLQNRANSKKYNLQSLSSQEIAKTVKESYSQTIKKAGFELKVFDFKKLLAPNSALQISADKDKIYISANTTDTAIFTAFSEGQSDLSSVSWIVKNEQGEVVDTGNGKTFVFEPKTFGCSYEITATLENDGEVLSATTIIDVVYMQDPCIEDEDIKLDIKDNNQSDNLDVAKDGSVTISSGQSLSFAIADYNSHASDADIIWYVNGEYVSSGEVFECLFQTVGEYNVQAKINGVYTSKTKVVVESGVVPDNNKSLNIIIVCCSVLGGVVVLSFVLAFIFARVKRKAR